MAGKNVMLICMSKYTLGVRELVLQHDIINDETGSASDFDRLDLKVRCCA